MVCPYNSFSKYFVLLAVLASWSLSPSVVEAQQRDAGREYTVKSGQELVLKLPSGKRARLWTADDLASERSIRKRGKRRSVAAADGNVVARKSRAGGKVRLSEQELALLCIKHLARGYTHCEPNVEVSVAATTNDALYSALYGIRNISAPEAWDTTSGSSDVLVAVVDTGVNYNHPDLSGSIAINGAEVPSNGIDDDGNGYIDDVYGYNAITGTGVGSAAGDPMDDNGHGTHVSGTIAAQGNNSIGVVGVAYGSKVIAIKALGAGGSGFISDIADGIDYAVARGARAINLSLSSSSDSSTLRASIEDARNSGVLVVAAAGNAATNIDSVPSYPAAYDYSNLISVASTDDEDDPSYFTNFSSTRVHVAAPGSDIASTSYTGGYVYMSGTSMATPHVAGVAALIFSVRPDLNASDVKTILINSVDALSSLNGLVSSNGRVNAARAVAQALGQEYVEQQVAVSASSRRSGSRRVAVSGRAYEATSAVGIAGETASVECRGRVKGSASTGTDGEFSIFVKRPRAGRAALRCVATVAESSSPRFRIRARK